MFWSDVRTFRPGMDPMVYGTLARHILASGDWSTLHYTKQAYTNFYLHLPLPFWMMAISMKGVEFFFGEAASNSDVVLKLLPSLVSASTVIAIYLWAKRIRGEGFAVLAAAILLTSTRFAKYSNTFMLDPFLAAFSVWAVYFAVVLRENGRYRADLALASGSASAPLSCAKDRSPSRRSG